MILLILTSSGWMIGFLGMYCYTSFSLSSSMSDPPRSLLLSIRSGVGALAEGALADGAFAEGAFSEGFLADGASAVDIFNNL